VLFRKSLARKFAIAIAILISIEMVVHTLMGSRGEIVGMIEDVIYIGLAVAGCIKIRRRTIALGFALLPVFVVLLIGSFAISTYNRALRITGRSFDLGAAVESASRSGSELSLGASLEALLPPIFNRAGYFDYSAEIIAHREQYRPLLNLSTYGKSIVDNNLTPGFDVYDQPKIGNSLQFIYNELGEPTHELVGEMYQSDQLGIYGEFYGVFGYACLPLLFLGTAILKRAYVGLKSASPFVFAMKRVVLLFVFARSVNSYGVDWTIGETLPLLAAIFIYALIFSAKRGPSGGRQLMALGTQNLSRV
jgi:hypothetical protein